MATVIHSAALFIGCSVMLLSGIAFLFWFVMTCFDYFYRQTETWWDLIHAAARIRQERRERKEGKS